jgi:hypothetical protein
LNIISSNVQTHTLYHNDFNVSYSRKGTSIAHGSSYIIKIYSSLLNNCKNKSKFLFFSLSNNAEYILSCINNQSGHFAFTSTNFGFQFESNIVSKRTIPVNSQENKFVNHGANAIFEISLACSFFINNCCIIVSKSFINFSKSISKSSKSTAIGSLNSHCVIKNVDFNSVRS